MRSTALALAGLVLLAPRVQAAGADPLALPAAVLAPFAKLASGKATAPTPAMDEKPATLKDAANRAAVLAVLGATLNPAEEAYLSTHRFLVLPKARTKFKGQVRFPGAEPVQFDEMTGMFDELGGANDPVLRKPENVKLVTPDIALHAFHKLLENALEHIEYVELGNTLRRFVSGMRARLVAAAKAAKGENARRLSTLAARFMVPEAILETGNWIVRDPGLGEPEKPLPADDVDTLAAASKKLDSFKADLSADDLKNAQAELKLIYAATETTRSPLFAGYAKTELSTDFSQYKPRSHYARKSSLRTYFRAMIYLGRNSWLFETDAGLGDALVLAWAFAGPDADGRPLLDSWKRIMEVTSFFAGVPDDVSYPSLRDFAVKQLGDAPLSVDAALDPANHAKLRAKLSELSPPRVLSDAVGAPDVPALTKDELLARTLGFRVLGQRFTLDGWLLGQLTQGKEKSAVRLPGVPSVAALAGAFGDATGKAIAGELLATETPAFTADETKAYLARIDALGAQLAKVADEDWFASCAAAWVKVLSTLTGTYGKGYPLYMTSPEFPLRQLAAFAGSYAELKHDTLLYAKPNYAEYGDGGEETTPPPVPRGLVEPNLKFWFELERLAVYYRDGVVAHKLIKGEEEEFSLSNRFVETVKFYASVAGKQLAGQKPTDDELERLRTTKLSEFAKPYESVILDDDEMRSALIADIHTDMVGQRILYEATAEPHFMLVLLSADGAPRLGVGVVFNPVELITPTGERLSDQDWRKRVYTGTPEVPASRVRGPAAK